jgi:hypothetical protein
MWNRKQPIKPPFRIILSVLISVLILYFYFHGINWRAILAAVRTANLPLAMLAVLIPQIVTWFCGVWITGKHIRWFHGPFDGWTYAWVRGAFYIVFIINPSIGTGGLLFYLKRKTGISWNKFAGIGLFRFGLAMWGIGLVMIPATIVLQSSGLAEKIHINMLLWRGLLIFGAAWLIEAWIYWRYEKGFGISSMIARNRGDEFWTAFRTATPRQWLITWALNLLPFFFMLFGFHLLARAFNIRIPWIEFMIASPIMFAIAEMPVSFGGFGTTTLAWMMFFGHYGSMENIAALTIFLPAARSVNRGLIGLISLPFAMGELPVFLRKTTPGQPAQNSADAES